MGKFERVSDDFKRSRNALNAGFKLVKRNQFAKNFGRSKEIGPTQAKKFLDLQIILWKMERVLTNFCKLIWTIMYYESL